MRFIREDAIEWTFVLMMNKLIFAREKVLQDLQRNIRKETHKEIFRRVDEIDVALEKNREKGETLTTIMTKGYIEPAMFTQEMNNLSAEADALADEREQLTFHLKCGLNLRERIVEV